MQAVRQIGARLAKTGPKPFLILGAVIMAVGMAAQFLQLDLPFASLGAQTAFGIAARIGGGFMLVGLLIMALRTDGSVEPDRYIPDEVPQSALEPKPAEVKRPWAKGKFQRKPRTPQVDLG